MEPGRTGPAEMEVLDTERPPGALLQGMSRLARRPVVRVAVVAAVSAVMVWVWTALPPARPAPVPQAERVADTPPGLRPPPARGRVNPTGSWQLANDLAIRTGPRGHAVTFTATNRGARAEDPRQLEVTGAFVDRPGLVYRATCSGAERTRDGYRTIRGSVEPRTTVLVRCRDVTAYGGRTAWIDPASVTVRRIPCESEGSSLRDGPMV